MFKAHARPVIKPVIKKPFILDTFNPNRILFAFSTARALSSLSSPLQIRRASDNAVLNIGYPGGVIDEQAIKDFGGKNLLGYTEDFSNSSWLKIGVGTGNSLDLVHATGQPDPDGGTNAGLIRFNGFSILRQVTGIKANEVNLSKLVGSFYVKGIANQNVRIEFRAINNFVIQKQVTFTGNWQRIDTAGASIDSSGTGNANSDILFGLRRENSNTATDLYIYHPQAEFNNITQPTIYQPRTAGGASDCFLASYQSVDINQPKIYDGATGEVIKENGKPAIVFDGAGDNLVIPNVAGKSNIDAYFVNRHDDTSTTAIDSEVYLYPTGSTAAQFGFVASKNSSTTSIKSSSYASVNLYKNNVLLSPTNRGNVYSLLGQTQNIVNHQGATLSGWSSYNYGRYEAGGGIFHFEGTLQEIIIFKGPISDNERSYLHSATIDFYNIPN